MDTDSDEDQIVKYNTALLANDSVTLKKKRRRLNRDIPSDDNSKLSLLNKENNAEQDLQSMAKESSHRKHGPWGCHRSMAISPRWTQRRGRESKIRTRRTRSSYKNAID